MKKRVTGRHVSLGPIKRAGLSEICKWKNDSSLARQILAHPIPCAETEMEGWFQKNQADKNQVLFGIYRNNKSQQIVGIARLMFIDWVSRTAELGIYLGDNQSRGKGLGSDALRLLLEFGFGGINLQRIWLKVSESNTVAIRYYEANGFKKEGVLRRHFWVGSKFENVVIMGILKEEFKSKKP